MISNNILIINHAPLEPWGGDIIMFTKSTPKTIKCECDLWISENNYFELLDFSGSSLSAILHHSHNCLGLLFFFYNLFSLWRYHNTAHIDYVGDHMQIDSSNENRLIAYT